MTAAALALAAGAYGASTDNAKGGAATGAQFSGTNVAFVLIAAAAVLIAAIGLRRSLTRRD